MGVAGAVAGTFGIQPLVGAFGVPYQAAEPKDERQIRVPLRIRGEMSQGVCFYPTAGLLCFSFQRTLEARKQQTALGKTNNGFRMFDGFRLCEQFRRLDP